MRDHVPLKITEFNGFWKRGDVESTPNDHFSDAQNIKYIESGFMTRDGLDVHLVSVGGCLNLLNIVRAYTYLRPDRQSLLVLDTDGNIYDTTGPTPCIPILTIVGMTDFSFAAWAGRAYITPHNGELGLQNEFVYVYLGYGASARKAAGAGPASTPAMTLALNFPGNISTGVHVFGVVFETDTGFLTSIGAFTQYNSIGVNKVDISVIPISADSFVKKRHIVATKAIDPLVFTGNLEEYEFFFIPNAVINDNTTTTLSAVNFYDSELIESASYLLDALSEIPAGVFINIYHNRLVVGGFYGAANSDPLLDTSENISTARVSTAGEPEAFDDVDGIIIAPIDGNPLTNGQEYRDLLYLFKLTRTYAYVDNDDVPSTWALSTIDQGIGCPPHGIATVLDSGGINIEYLIICDYSGVILFNGTYARPELSWKIQDYWLALDRDEFDRIQILNDTIGQLLYIVLPDWTMLYADCADGLNPKDIKWCPWVFPVRANTIAFINTNTLIIGSSGLMP